MITITPQAQLYLKKIKNQPDHQQKEFYLTVIDPDTLYAEAGLTLTDIAPEHTEDFIVGFPDFQLFVSSKNLHFLQDAVIDIEMKNLQTEIIIHTPHLIPADLLSETDLVSKIEFFLEREINPALASHGGRVTLVNVTNDNKVFLQFSGGCQGCAQIDMTLQYGIKQSLMEHLPEIQDVIDITNHTEGSMPYYSIKEEVK